MDKSVDGVDNLPESSKILGIFAKEPVPGQVKTRLTPPLSPDEAATLYQVSLQETVERMAGSDFDLVLCYAGSESYFRESFPGIRLYKQNGNDLGHRMNNALQHFFQQGYRRAVLIGSDSPDLPSELVAQAFVCLERRHLVLAPAHDGGYVLIGESLHYPQLFEEMPWSSPEVLSLTRQRADADGIDYHLLPAWDDLDDRAALNRFLQRSHDSKTAAYLRCLTVMESFPESE